MIKNSKINKNGQHNFIVDDVGYSKLILFILYLVINLKKMNPKYILNKYISVIKIVHAHLITRHGCKNSENLVISSYFVRIAVKEHVKSCEKKYWCCWLLFIKVP